MRNLRRTVLAMTCSFIATVGAEQIIPLPLEFGPGATTINPADMVFVRNAARRLTGPGVPVNVTVLCSTRPLRMNVGNGFSAADLCRVRVANVVQALQDITHIPAHRFKTQISAVGNALGDDVMTLTPIYGEIRRESPPATNPTPARVIGSKHRMSLSFNNADLAEVFQMLSREQRINILLAEGVAGTVSVNLYDVDVGQAITTIADAAGFAVEKRNGAYFVLKRADAGKYAAGGLTAVRTFKLHYSDPQIVANTVDKHRSNYGKVTVLAGRKQVVVEDTPEFLNRIARLIHELDVEPAQFLIEAKILEISLNKNETFGIDWSKAMQHDGDGTLSFGTPGTAAQTTADLLKSVGGAMVLGLATPDLRIYLQALGDEGRVRTLSTPKLLTLEDQEADVLVGNRIGYRTTVTINQVTTENIQFLESGVKLNVVPSLVDGNKILLRVHPEVSAGFLTSGETQLPQQNTTAVTTQLMASDGETVFIGGLIKSEKNRSRSGIPGLSDVPVLGRVFSNSNTRSNKSETIVLITPHLVSHSRSTLFRDDVNKVELMDDEDARDRYDFANAHSTGRH